MNNSAFLGVTSCAVTAIALLAPGAASADPFTDFLCSSGSSQFCPPPQAPPPGAAPPQTQGCHPSYDPCLPPHSDYDSADGSGDGPGYADRVRITGPDEYALDRDGDGIGCE
jgi:hypothetical protein